MKPSVPFLSRRLLRWPNCLNTRELGGYQVSSGGQVRWQALLRSDNLAHLTPESQKLLVDYGIRSIIDLRFPGELEDMPNPFSKVMNTGVSYLNLPLDLDVDLGWSPGQDWAAAMSKMYIELLEKNRVHISAVLTAIAHAQPGGVLFHCHAGKDRTGLIAALVLSALGVPQETIVADYSFESDLSATWRKKVLSNPSLSPEKRNYLEVLSSSLPETMQRTLDQLDQRYGSVEGFLLSTSLSREDLGLLFSRLVEI